MTANRSEKGDTYTIHDIRWAKLKGFTLGFVSGCGALVGLVNFLLALRGLGQ